MLYVNSFPVMLGQFPGLNQTLSTCLFDLIPNVLVNIFSNVVIMLR